MTTPSKDNRPRGQRGRLARDPALVERDARAARLRSSGATYDQIAAQIGYSDRGDAYRAIQRVMADTIAEPAEEVRRFELDRLDTMWRRTEVVLGRPHFVVTTAGKVATHPDTGEPLVDDAPVLAALGVQLRIQERRSKLLGLDAPTRTQAEVTHVDGFHAELAQLMAELAAGGAAGADGVAQVRALEGPGPA